MAGEVGNLFARDNRTGSIYEILRWAQDIDLPLYEHTELTLKHVLTGETMGGSIELLSTYFSGVCEMEVLAWAARSSK